jgi:hypothetical protein
MDLEAVIGEVVEFGIISGEEATNFMDIEAVIGGGVEYGLIHGDESNECHVVDAEGKILLLFPEWCWRDKYDKYPSFQH